MSLVAQSRSRSNSTVGPSSDKKRKRVVLSIHQKQQVLDRLDDGEKPAVIAESFGISRQQVSDIKKNESRIQKYCNSSQNISMMKRKTLRATTAPTIERDLLLWFANELDEGRMVTSDMLHEKALELFAQQPQDEMDLPVKATNGWMRNFKRRHGIKRQSQGDGYDGLILPSDVRMNLLAVPDRSNDHVDDSFLQPTDPALRALVRRVNSLEQVMQENVMHLESRIDEILLLLNQQQHHHQQRNI